MGGGSSCPASWAAWAWSAAMAAAMASAWRAAWAASAWASVGSAGLGGAAAGAARHSAARGLVLGHRGFVRRGRASSASGGASSASASASAGIGAPLGGGPAARRPSAAGASSAGIVASAALVGAAPSSSVGASSSEPCTSPSRLGCRSASASAGAWPPSSVGNWSRLARPRSSRNWRVVANSDGRPGRVAMADGLDPAAILELLDDLAAHHHAADVLDVAARDRLAVGDDGQRLEHGARVLGRLLGMQAVEELAQLRAALEAPARGDGDQLDAAAAPLAHQLVEHRAQRVRADLVIEQVAHRTQRQRLIGTDQRGFKNALGILSIHRRISGCPPASAGQWRAGVSGSTATPSFEAETTMHGRVSGRIPVQSGPAGFEQHCARLESPHSLPQLDASPGAFTAGHELTDWRRNGTL